MVVILNKGTLKRLLIGGLGVNTNFQRMVVKLLATVSFGILFFIIAMNLDNPVKTAIMLFLDIVMIWILSKKAVSESYDIKELKAKIKNFKLEKLTSLKRKRR